MTRNMKEVITALVAMACGLAFSSWVTWDAVGASTPAVYGFGVYGEQGPANAPSATPTPLTMPSGDLEQLVATNSDDFALTTTGLWSRGAGNLGELGNGKTASSFDTWVRVKIPSGVTVTSLPLDMPYATGVALASGVAYGWGANAGGELCTNGQQDRPVVLKPDNVTLAAGGGEHMTYVTGGIVKTCGMNQYDQRGNAAATGIGPTKVIGLPAADSWTSVVAGFGTTAVLDAAGNVYDWGLNADGQLGDGTTTNAPAAEQVNLGQPAVTVNMGGNDSGDGHTFATLADGSIEEWGTNDYGQLCDGDTSDVLSPQAFSIPGESITMAAAGGASSYFTTASGATYDCGSRKYGALADGSTTGIVTTPEAMDLTGVTFAGSESHNVVMEVTQ